LYRLSKLSYLGLASVPEVASFWVQCGGCCFSTASRRSSAAQAEAPARDGAQRISGGGQPDVQLLSSGRRRPVFERKANKLAMTSAGRAYQSG